MNRFFRTFSRLFVGAVFVFSGFVKGVDPLGFAYKLDDYFVAFGMEWAMIFSLFLSVMLCAVEFTVGAMLLSNIKMKFTSWIVTLMMAFFTLLTLNDAIFEPVPDCGCFGDAIKLTNWETFYKNIVLDVFVVIIFLSHNKYKSSLKCVTQWLLTAIYFVVLILFSFYNYRHLPLIDFRPYKVGNKIEMQSDTDAVYYLQYKDIETGEQKEYISPNYPWNDSVWLSKWEYVGQRIEKQGAEEEYDFAIETLEGDNVTESVLEWENVFVFVSYDLSKLSEKDMEKVDRMIQELNQDNIEYIWITASLPEEIEKISERYPYFDSVFLADAIMLKTMIRANPGLVWLDKGTIKAKWHQTDFPSAKKWSEIQNQIR